MQKMGEIKSWHRSQRIRHIVCAVLAPGGGHLSDGRLLPGLLLLLPASFLQARLMFGGGAFPSPWSLGGVAASWVAGAGLVLFAALWLLSLALTLRFEE